MLRIVTSVVYFQFLSGCAWMVALLGLTCVILCGVNVLILDFDLLTSWF